MGRARKKQGDWHLKVQPELLEMLRGYRDTVRSWEQSDKTPETAKMLEQKLAEQLWANLPEELTLTRQSPEEAIYPLFSAVMDEVPLEAALAVGIPEKMHWLRFREPLLATHRRYQAGRLEASEKIHRTTLDYDRLQLGGKPLRRFKTNYDHDVIFSSGWGHGLENLWEEELAECFQEFCPCGRDEHDGHALRMQRDRMFRALTVACRKSSP
jgi:hypothetical protein